MQTRFTLPSFALPTGVVVLLAAIALSAAEPQYTAEGKLQFPSDYREWVFLSAGRGMTYGPNARQVDSPPFDNVFVSPEAYQEFKKTGRWPDKAMFVLEIRRSATEGSINSGGQFQKDAIFSEVEVKDESRFEGGWGFFEFAPGSTEAPRSPYTADCYSCHRDNTAVENTFVQFYPTLMPIARERGTVKERYEKSGNPAANE